MPAYKVGLKILLSILVMIVISRAVIADSSMPETGAEAIGGAIGGLGNSIINHQNVTNQRKKPSPL